MDTKKTYDVAIIGGGPAGTTVASLIRKYNPDLSVLILEKEKFPREHVGESQLPLVGTVLNEMGCWDKVEQAGFPIKLGVSYTWGRESEPWEFDLYPAEEFIDEPRPSTYTGQRRQTAFQVERALYDNILLRHAEEMGTEVREETGVTEIRTDGDRIESLVLSTGDTVEAGQYVDASGHVGIIRRAMGVESEAPKELRNVAFWDYWDNAKWKVEIGVGGTRVYVRSLPFGWIWFIPLSPTRASVGLICPSEYYKNRGVTPRELYDEAISMIPDISAQLSDAKSELNGESVHTTKNWSHLSSRLVGENWWLCGESAGFADPILAAGMTLAHASAREVAYSILDIVGKPEDEAWVRERYDVKNRKNIEQHIRFAQYWYAANGQFTDLQDHCESIAKDAGLKLSPKEAWRWLAQGGFATEFTGRASVGSFSLNTGKHLVERFLGAEQKLKIAQYNVFKLNVRGAVNDVLADFKDGKIERVPCYRRGEAVLPLAGRFGEMVEMLKKTSSIATIYQHIQSKVVSGVTSGADSGTMAAYMEVLEAMMIQGWVTGKYDARKPSLKIGSSSIRTEKEAREAMSRAKGTIKIN